MEIKTLKYQFIEEIVRLNNPEILLNLTNLLKKLKKQKPKTHDWMRFAGIWNDEEANDILHNIKDCEKIDLNEW